MKKMLSVLLAVILTVTFSTGVSAAGTSATLYESDTSKSTKRVKAKQHATYSVVNTGKYDVHYKIFKDGVQWGSALVVKPGKRSSGKSITGKDVGYSLRMYCKSSTGKGCSANGGLITH